MSEDIKITGGIFGGPGDALEAFMSPIKEPNKSFIDTRQEMVKELTDFVDEKFPGHSGHMMHEHNLVSILQVPGIGREFFVKLVVPELERKSVKWGVQIYYNHIQYSELMEGLAGDSPDPVGVIFVDWKDSDKEPVARLVKIQAGSFENWKLSV